MSKNESKLKIIAQTLAAIEKHFGKGAVMALGERAAQEVEVISTGSYVLDRALGVGGLPRGRVIEVYGPESSGKTTVALHAIAEAQRKGGLCAFIDAEHALDVSYAAALGVKIDELLVSQPDCGEQALEITDQLVRSGALDLVVIDSVAALVPKAELDGEMGDAHVGLQARLMSQAMRKLTGSSYRHNTGILFINQTRQKIGVTYGSNITTTGGNALKFYASVRLEIRRIGAVKEGEEVVGNRTRVKVVKNKVAPPFREAEFEIVYGRGINREGELLDEAVARGVVRKSGAWYALDELQLGQGRAAACRFLLEREDVRTRLEASCARGAPSTVDAPETAPKKSTEDAAGAEAKKSTVAAVGTAVKKSTAATVSAPAN